MNKIDFAKINKKEDMIMAFNQLKDDYSIAFHQITQLTNNWNELEEFLESNWKDTQDIWYVKIINKMKEIKGKNDNI